jgi:hypothetical protein
LEVFIISRIETFLFHEFPQSFDQIEVGRVRWEKEDFNIQTSSNILDILTPLIPSIIHNERDGDLEPESSYFFQELAHTHRIDVRVIGHRDELMGHGIECS